MKYVQSITFRALSAICIGCLLVAFPNEATSWLVRIIGILFLIPGLVSIVAYFHLRSKENAMRPLLPFLGIGSLFFGLLLILSASSLMNYMMYLLAVYLIAAGLSQIVAMIKVRTLTEVSFFFYLMPVLVILVGIITFFNVELINKYILYILGITSIVYGIVELIMAIHFRKERRILMQKEKDTTTPKEEKSEEETTLTENATEEAKVVEEPAEAAEEQTVPELPVEKETKEENRIDFSTTETVEEN